MVIADKDVWQNLPSCCRVTHTLLLLCTLLSDSIIPVYWSRSPTVVAFVFAIVTVLYTSPFHAELSICVFLSIVPYTSRSYWLDFIVDNIILSPFPLLEGRPRLL